jgi:hypothetical protein
MTMDNVARSSASSPMTLRVFLKKMLCVGSLFGFVVLLSSVAMAGSVPATRGIGKCPCQCPNGRTVWIDKSCGNESDCYGPCGMTNSPSSSPPGRDYGAEQREQHAAAAEEQRRRDAELEQQRREAENKRRLEEIERQTKFLNDRDAAASTLRGSIGTGTPVNGSGGTGLRGSTGTGAAANAAGGTGLRGSRTDAGLRGLKSGTTQTPNLDPMVVDARNVPSGLPKSVDEAIPHTPAGDRVRKGFQAIAEHDWEVALAWFQDALNHEPGSPGLRRLVDLAQYTLQRQSKPAIKPPGAARTGTNGKTDKILNAGMSQELDRSLKEYYKNNPPKFSKYLKPSKDIQSDTEWLNEKEPAWKNFFRLFTPTFKIDEVGPTFGGIRG